MQVVVGFLVVVAWSLVAVALVAAMMGVEMGVEMGEGVGT